MLLYKNSQYFLILFDSSSGNVKVELDLSHYAIKADLKRGTGAYTSTFSAKSDLASLKA